jgi:lipoyl synthase
VFPVMKISGDASRKIMNSNQRPVLPVQKPPWLRRRLPSGPDYESVRTLLKDSRLHTVCQEARCPNQWECFSARTATFLIMGSSCTRSCRFCAVDHGPVNPLDTGEPLRIAETARQLGLTYVVITSVTRDDLSDGGAHHFAETIRAVRGLMPQAGIEVLIPDFQGNPQALETVMDAGPDVLNHNMETVPRLYPVVRAEAVYERSLFLISQTDRKNAFRGQRTADSDQIRADAGNGGNAGRGPADLDRPEASRLSDTDPWPVSSAVFRSDTRCAVYSAG